MFPRFALLLLAPLLLPLAAPSTLEPSQQGGGGGGGGGRGANTPLSGHMGELERVLKAVNAAIEADEGLAVQVPEVCKVQKTWVDAKTLTPKMLEEMEPGKKRDKALLEFRVQMQDVLRSLLDLELALVQEDGKKTKKALREIAKLESGGHGKFREMGGR